MLAPFALCGMCLSTIRPFKSVVGNHQRVPGLPILPIQQQWRALPRVGARACSSDEELLPLVVCIGQLNQPRPYQHRDHQGAPFENGRSEQGRIDAPGGPQLRQSVVQKVRILPRHSRPPQTTSSPFTNIKPGTREIAVFSTRAGVRLDHAEPTPASGRPATLPLACGTPSSAVPAGSAQLSFPRNRERSPSFRFTAPPFPTTCRSAGRRWYTRYPSLRYNSAAGNRPYNRRNVASPRLPTAKSDHRPPSGSSTTAVQIRRNAVSPDADCPRKSTARLVKGKHPGQESTRDRGRPTGRLAISIPAPTPRQLRGRWRRRRASRNAARNCRAFLIPEYTGPAFTPKVRLMTDTFAPATQRTAPPPGS